MIRLQRCIFFLGLLLTAPLVSSQAQKVCDVTGRYIYIVSDNDNITLKEAKHRCIELARAEAIKRAFGEFVTSDVIDTRSNTSGESSQSYYWENTIAMARGEWLGDITPASLQIQYFEGRLIFTAEVNGTAREILQAKTMANWQTLKDLNGSKIQTSEFISGERICLQFQSPTDGYLAVYLISGDDNTSCLLPYPKDSDGKFHVKGGKTYILFDKDQDNSAYQYRLKTQHPQEENQIVLIFSPNSFIKCNETSGDSRHPGVLHTHDFQRWLLNCQRQDQDMVVDKKWVRIITPQ